MTTPDPTDAALKAAADARARHAKAGNTAAVTVLGKRIDQLLDRKNAAAAKEATHE